MSAATLLSTYHPISRFKGWFTQIRKKKKTLKALYFFYTINNVNQSWCCSIYSTTNAVPTTACNCAQKPKASRGRTSPAKLLHLLLITLSPDCSPLPLTVCQYPADSCSLGHWLSHKGSDGLMFMGISVLITAAVNSIVLVIHIFYYSKQIVISEERFRSGH